MGTPELRASSNGSSPNCAAVPLGSTRMVAVLLRPYPRDRMIGWRPAAVSNFASSRTNGVLPVPPVERLPTLMTGWGSDFAWRMRRSKARLRAAVAAA